MRTALGLAAVFVMLPLTADARPITLGASLGVSHAQEDADSGVDPARTLGLFARLGFTSRIAGQLELSKLETETSSGVSIRTGTALLVVDLTDNKTWVPTIVAGLGLDNEDDGFSSKTGQHIEGGFGLEYRSPGGLTVGADVRLGGRSLEGEDIQNGDDIVFLVAPSRLSPGEYRSARLWLGVRF